MTILLTFGMLGCHPVLGRLRRDEAYCPDIDEAKETFVQLQCGRELRCKTVFASEAECVEWWNTTALPPDEPTCWDSCVARECMLWLDQDDDCGELPPLACNTWRVDCP